MKRLILPLIIAFGILTSGCQSTSDSRDNVIDLSGNWSFQLDPDEKGLEEGWFKEDFSDSVFLPGTTDENKKGIFKDEKAVERLSRVWYWKGAAWYQKEVDIPEDWKGKNVKLLLERTKDTHVWFDDNHCGYENTLSAPQYFDLTKAVKPGRHRITVLVDNSKLPPVGPSHAVDERTQTNWNGIVGRIELQAIDHVWIKDIQIYPDVEGNKVKVSLTISNISGNPASCKIRIKAESWNTTKPLKFKSQVEKLSGVTHNQDIELVYEFNKTAPLWDEFDPALIRLNIELAGKSGDIKFAGSSEQDFGMREFRREGKYILINGKRIFLRGRTDSANYPLTGYPPMNKEAWLKYFRLLKSYGINHWRFHSWCPPEEALAAADIVGVYLQPELPNKRSGMDNKSMKEEEVRKLRNIDYLDVDKNIVNSSLKDYLKREGELIFKHFGNHPSFVMFTLGNELGRNPAMFELVRHFKSIDPRRLYAQGSNTMHWDQSFAEGDDFWVCAKTGTEQGPVRGSYFHVDYDYGHIENFPPSTLVNYSESLKDVQVPVIGHETGQFQVSPNFEEIPKFTGVTRARNYEIFMDRLEEANMLDQAADFVKASGKLAVVCYREDIETALRTPDFAGFQLLDVQDFPGQGTALVGILDAFMEPKGIVSREKWNQFCSEVVPLLEMEKYTWTNNEDFEGEIRIANYGPEDFTNIPVIWEVVDSKDDVVEEGRFENKRIDKGGLRGIGEISFGLTSIIKAEKLRLVISLEGTKYKNEYDIWVYPRDLEIIIPEDIMVSSELDSKTKTHLEKGGKAIIFPDHSKLENCIHGAFQTDFWCYPMFARGAIRNGVEPAPGSLGFMCDPASPLFEHFPTEFHSNWQWWHLAKNCKPIILDETPAEYKPMVQTIDNFARNHKLGMIFETKYGEGKVLICAIDLLNLQEKPEGRQLYYSMLRHVDSEKFDPDMELSRKFLQEIIP